MNGWRTARNLFLCPGLAALIAYGLISVFEESSRPLEKTIVAQPDNMTGIDNINTVWVALDTTAMLWTDSMTWLHASSKHFVGIVVDGDTVWRRKENQ